MNWAKICELIQSGRLAIRNLRRFNQALLGKWLWRYGMKWEAFWKKVVDVKYGSLWGGWCANVVNPYGVSLWKSIRWEWARFSQYRSFGMGDGVKVKFWNDLWCDDMPLKVAYPKLFSIARDREASVAALMSFGNGTLH